MTQAQFTQGPSEKQKIRDVAARPSLWMLQWSVHKTSFVLEPFSITPHICFREIIPLQYGKFSLMNKI